ncbi:helicase-related protein [Agrococcus sp. 1P02AA]|uniref:sacsin N-terminal ATP-binding-like domain-containing protein n=1 Tax=Agrococcus sp. 1P02AA TaxID=3132259 RepID=UPI0039A4634C
MWPKPDPELVEFVQSLFDNAISAYGANPVLVRQDANHEENIRVGGYSDRTLMELVQNAADALQGAGQRGRVELVLTDEALYCANEGRPFSKSGIEAVSHAFLDVKQGDEIGRFGLGFKSTLALSDAPMVLSRSVAFAFNTPESISAIQSISGAGSRIPKLRAPVVVQSEQVFASDPVARELAEWATTVIKLPLASRADSLIAQLGSFNSEFLLFVEAVSAIRLRSTREDAPVDVSHVSRDLGDGRVRIESPETGDSEWLVAHEMHRPSARAREDVGQAVARTEIKISVAVPVHRSDATVGRFWSYFPLEDKTTASALFNAPWSVNDDRTTLLRKQYNREIVHAMAAMFVELLSELGTDDDPARHLDYMTARGREALSFGDEILSAAIPNVAAKRGLIPDVTGTLRRGSELRTLDFEVLQQRFEWGDLVRARAADLGSAVDEPHFTAFLSPSRRTRLADLFLYEHVTTFELLTASERDRALEALPSKVGVATWLGEWARVSEHAAANSLKLTVALQRQVPSANEAPIVPLVGGGSAKLTQSREVHLPSSEHRGEAGFVSPSFVAIDGVKRLLTEQGFRELTPAVRLEQLVTSAHAADDAAWEAIWGLAAEMPVGEAARAMASVPRVLLVPTHDAGWHPASSVWDIPELAAAMPDRTLDHSRCTPAIASRIGVANKVTDEYPISNEPAWALYVEQMIELINRGLGPGERSVSRLEVLDGFGPGPFSVLQHLPQDGFSLIQWTKELLGTPAPVAWQVEDATSPRIFDVPAPHIWAARKCGRIVTTLGPRPVAAAVAPVLTAHGKLLPVAAMSMQTSKALQLAETLDEVGDAIWDAFLNANHDSSASDAALSELTLRAIRARGKDFGRIVPARVGRSIEPFAVANVFVARDEEQAVVLRERQRPYLLALDEAVADALIEEGGLRAFEDAYSFSLIVEGASAGQPVLDVFPGLREQFFANSIADVELVRAERITKRVAAEEGVEDHDLHHARDGQLMVVVRASASRFDILRAVRDELELPIEDMELEQLERLQLRRQAALLKEEARAATSDAERLEAIFGEDDLREKLPHGLWDAVIALGGTPSIGQLLLDTYGQRTLSELKDLFEQEGFYDFPRKMAGLPAAVDWVESFGFSSWLAGPKSLPPLPAEFVVPGRPNLSVLHDFQVEAQEQLQAVLLSGGTEAPARKVMLQLPTGAGKTRTAVESVLRLFESGELRGTILWIAQTAELCEQAVQTWSEVWRWIASSEPLSIGRLWGAEREVEEPETELSIVVATDAKLREALAKPEYRWLLQPAAVFVDEAHVAGSSTEYRQIFSHLGVDGRSFQRPLVGLSATPFKGYSQTGNESLAARFGNQKIDPLGDNAHARLVERGVLARVQHEVLDGIDIHLDAGERSTAEQTGRLAPDVLARLGRDKGRMKILVEHVLGLDPDWPVLVFTPSVLSAQTTAAVLKNQGVAAAALSGQTSQSERREQIRRFKDGDLRVLVNCDLLTQGFDAPSVRALYIARPTLSPNRYIQMVGRGLRGPQNGGKSECLIVDLKDNFGEMNRDLAFRDFDYLWES